MHCLHRGLGTVAVRNVASTQQTDLVDGEIDAPDRNYAIKLVSNISITLELPDGFRCWLPLQARASLTSM